MLLQQRVLALMQRRLLEGLGRHASQRWLTRHQEDLLVGHNMHRPDPPLLAGQQALQCPNNRTRTTLIINMEGIIYLLN